MPYVGAILVFAIILLPLLPALVHISVDAMERSYARFQRPIRKQRNAIGAG